MIKFGAVVNVAGDGYWTTFSGQVRCTVADVPYINDEADFGELRVYFNTQDWDVDEVGLIYTDSKFIAEVKEIFKAAGFDSSDISYSEQGMQGDDYVSMDVGQKFLKDWAEIVG
jgi:hypothetical protein